MVTLYVQVSAVSVRDIEVSGGALKFHAASMMPTPSLSAFSVQVPNIRGLFLCHMLYHTNASELRRRVTFTAQLKADEKAEYVRHGDCITVKLMNLPTNFWYSHTTARRFVIDPAEFDADYQAGVNNVEKGMSATPAHWKNSWVNHNISRYCIPSDREFLGVRSCSVLPALWVSISDVVSMTSIGPVCRLVRAKALRTFATNKAYIKPAKYYQHFSGLCKSMQKLHPPLSSDENEKAYERGCARTVGCASAVSFKMLTALPKETMCDLGDFLACFCAGVSIWGHSDVSLFLLEVSWMRGDNVGSTGLGCFACFRRECPSS